MLHQPLHVSEAIDTQNIKSSAEVAKSQKCLLVHGQLVVRKALVRTKALLARTQINSKERFVNIMI